ncbi:alpha/beta hydrolase [Marinactinospora rubrisoli]|uniref:Alpha/beta hydrolase n=1 Tax=Marinactinospora rubrisoli TaxID=2715399 RepID=A0ABW2KCU9_9ACTN
MREPSATGRETHTGGVSRRGLLRAATVLTGTAGGAALTVGTPPAHASPRPDADADRPTFVIVHGSNGNAQSYAQLVAGLAMAGHHALAVDLPGHGSAANFPLSYQAPQDLDALATEPSPVLAETTLGDNVRHVTQVVRRAARHGPVVLVGHSMGGATITGVANEVPDLISRLVYLTAFCCVRLRSVFDYVLTPEAGTPPVIPGVGDPERLGVNRTNWRSADPEFLTAAKAALAENYDDNAFRSILNTFEPDESALVPLDDARSDTTTWGRVPRSYIRCTLDRTIPLALQDRMIREADEATPGNRFDVHLLEAPHVGPESPEPLVEILGDLG